MALPLKIDGRKCTVPTSLEELTLDQWLKIQAKPKNDAALFEILTGVPYDVWFNTSQVSVDATILPAVQFLYKDIDLKKLKRKKYITIKGKRCRVPKDLGLKTYGQKILLHQKLKEVTNSKKHIDTIMPYALAVYFYDEFYTGSIDEKKVKKLTKYTKRALLVEAHPVGSFFLLKLIKSLSVKIKN